MPIGAPYATLAQLKLRLKIPAINTDDDAALTNALAAESAEIEGHCGRQFNTNAAASGSGAGVTYTGTGLVDTGANFYAAQIGQVVTSGANTATITVVTNATTLVVTTWTPGTPSAAAAYSIPAVLGTRIYYPTDTDIVDVDDFSSVTGLVVAVDYTNDGIYETTVAAANYQLEPLNGVVDGTPGFPLYRIRAINVAWPASSVAPIQVTARWGWAAVPTAVTEACLILSELTAKLSEAPYGVAGTDAFGIVRVRDNPQAAKLLERYTFGSVA